MSAPVWIEDALALALHERLLTVHGGAEGVRDNGLFQSALARPLQHYAYAEETVSIVDLAALYTAAIIRNHPFVDGNKRTGFVVGILFLELNGFTFSASEEDAAQAVLSLASGDIDEKDYSSFLSANSFRNR